MQTLLVTGAAGFIGSNFVRHALAEGYRVIGLDSLTYAGSRESLLGLGNNVELVVEDIRSPKIGDVLKRTQPDAILNFAAESHVDRSISNPLIFVETNVLGTANLLNFSMKYWEEKGKPSTFRFLQVSTDEVFGSLDFSDDTAFSETTPVRPSSPYSASKAGGDHLVSAWNHTYKFPSIITRCSNNYGPYQFPEKLIPHMILSAISGRKLPVYGNGSNVRDWIHVEDHCAGIMLALTKAEPGKQYCLGGRSERKNLDVVKLICSHLDKLRPRADGGSYSDQIAFVQDRLGHDLRYAIDDTAAEKELGFKRKHSFEKGLENTIRWYLENEEWVKAISQKERAQK